MNDNVSLNDMMDKTPRTGTGITFDATKGVPGVNPVNVNVENNEEKKMEAKPIVTGHIDLNTTTAADINDILPPRKEENKGESELMSALDEAVAREKDSIDQRLDDIFEMQRMEKEEQELKEAGISNTPVIDTKEDDGFDGDLGLYDEDDDTSDITPESSVKLTPKFNFKNTEDSVNEIVNEEKPIIIKDETEPKIEYSSINEDISSIINVNDKITPDNVVDITETKENELSEYSTAPDNDIKLEQRHTKTDVDTLLGIEDDDDIFKDDNATATDGEDAQVNDMIEDLKVQMKDRVSPIKKKLDLSKFSIAKKAIGIQKVMNLAIKNHQNAADWIMYNAERPIAMLGLSGQEIIKLNPDNSTRNRLNTFRDMYRIIYDHIEDANKPNYETWLKKTKFIDMPHIYFALYMATFGSSNFVNYVCPKCKKAFIKDINLNDMVEYKNDEVKEKVKAIRNKDTTTKDKDSYDVDLVQISDSYVFGLHTPSIWNVIIETASLPESFLEKYADLIDIISYIDSIYLIDESNSSLIPVDTKPDPNDQSKTTARKIKAFYDVIHTLTTDEFYGLRKALLEYDKNADDITYLIPSCTCPDCATEIPANKDITPDNMLFTRHQLVAIGNM